MGEETYEDGFGALRRCFERLARPARWWVKSAAGVPRKILVELRWRLGDEIMALPIFETLRAKYPVAHIAVLSHYPDLFENHPFVDAVNTIPTPVDRYLFLRGAPRQVFRLEHYARRAGVSLPVSRPHLYYEDWGAPCLDALPKGAGPLIALAAGASWKTKRWRPERWRALAQVLEQRGARLVELGHAPEALGLGFCLGGRTSVREAACVLHHADLLVCCDSGLMHLALAAVTPVVALFGPTDPFILIRKEPNFNPLVSEMECSGHWNRAEAAPAIGVCPYGHECCLDTITVDDVIEAIEKRVTL